MWDDADGEEDLHEMLPGASLIEDSTRIEAPRLVPEIELHLAADDLPLFRMGEDELEAAGLGTPYWAFAWAGGQALARYILDTPSVVRGRRVLDLGAGSGLVAIAAAKAGAFDVTANDIDPMAAEAMQLNADLNGVYLDIVAEDLVGSVNAWDTVLVGDVFYDAEITGLILPWLKSLVADGAEVLVGDPGRFYLPKLGLQRIASYHAPTTSLMEDSDLRNAGVWRFQDI